MNKHLDLRTASAEWIYLPQCGINAFKLAACTFVAGRVAAYRSGKHVLCFVVIVILGTPCIPNSAGLLTKQLTNSQPDAMLHPLLPSDHHWGQQRFSGSFVQMLPYDGFHLEHH